ncbi:C-type lectin domain family 17, member A-like [Polypterus senegalus]|uniref:C-type lectin domain family 17, member A-like n=1 Tax=Polypterus senegalus TaxID=55291 RepID=UPI001963E900|nr:C-type lectin domain family 17, member A-like [Polypterus senegalus]XP_039628381.1 C-type lectin domain family 17, member A-like [Polypterus senegalus]
MESADGTFYTEMDTDALESKGPPSWRTTGAPLKLRCPVRPLYIVGGGSALLWIVLLCLHVTKSSEMSAKFELLRAEEAKIRENFSHFDVGSMKATIQELQAKVSEVSSQMKNWQSSDHEVSAKFRKLESGLKEQLSNMSSQLDNLRRAATDMSSKIRKVESDLKDVAASNHWRDFDGHKYYFSTKMNSWEFARNACANVSSYLVVITSDLEKAFISSHILDKSWVGLNDLDKESVWKWITGQPMDKRFWEPGEPNNAGNEDCGELMKNGRINDIPCAEQRLWVCEKEGAAEQGKGLNGDLGINK